MSAPEFQAEATVHARSMALSVTVHVLLLLALLLAWSRSSPAGSGEPDRGVAIVLAEPSSDTQYYDEQETPDEPVDEVPAELAAALPSAAEPPAALPTPPASPDKLNLPLPGSDAAAMARARDPGNAPRSLQLTEAQQRMLDAERAAFDARRPKGPPTTLHVFGSGNLTGRKFVFVLDRSKSMGSQGLNVLRAAASELAGAIGQLEDHHEFQIIAYHHATLTIGRRVLLPASEANKDLVREFVLHLAAFGGTNHEGALMVALGMDPDVIVLMTDGGLPELNEGQLLRIRRAAGPTQIHCLQFGSGPASGRESFMQQLAAENDGSYRYIDVTRWQPAATGGD